MEKKFVKIIKSFLKIKCKLSELDQRLLDFAKKNNLKKNIFKDFKSILNLKKLNQDIILSQILVETWNIILA